MTYDPFRLCAGFTHATAAAAAAALSLLPTSGAGVAEGAPPSGLKQIKLLCRAGEQDVVRVADLQKIAPDFDGRSVVLTVNGAATPEEDARSTAPARVIPAQADDLDGDGKPDEIAFTVEAGRPDSSCAVTLTYGPEEQIAPLRPDFPRRAHALFARKYEGMGWESDRVAWRIYLDERNAIDLYGKKKHGLALDHFAAPGVDYHAESPVGRDIFRNGAALGPGSIGAVVDGKVVRVSEVADRQWRVLADGPVRAIAQITYAGWKVGGKSVELTSRFTIWAGRHHFEHRVTARNAEGVTLVTGLPVKPGVEIRMPAAGAKDGRRYLATWGKQVLRPGASATESEPDENLGLAIVLPAAAEGDQAGPPNESDTLLRLALDKDNTARFLVAAAWDQEQPDVTLPAAVRSAAAWEKFVASLPVADPVVRILSRAARPAPARFAPAR